MDPLEILFVHEVMRPEVVALPATSTVGDMQAICCGSRSTSAEAEILPVVRCGWNLSGVLTRTDMRDANQGSGEAALRRISVGDIVRRETAESASERTVAAVVYQMAEMAYADAGGGARNG